MNMQMVATYKDGVLRPDQPLPLAEGQRVQLTIQPAAEKRSYALLTWTRSQEDLEYLINDADCKS